MYVFLNVSKFYSYILTFTHENGFFLIKDNIFACYVKLKARNLSGDETHLPALEQDLSRNHMTLLLVI